MTNLLLLFSFCIISALAPDSVTLPVRESVEASYTKTEVMIPMRDSVELYTAVYQPVKVPEGGAPVIVMRTPYSPSPFGQEFSSLLWKDLKYFSLNSYIIVIQSVRGTYLSGGDYVQMRPLCSNEPTVFRNSASGPVPCQVDEATDSYDTVEWLLENTASNGRVGFTGVSYPGFYAMMAAVSGHPAIKAVSPQAPATDWFMGDDIHHNGALMLLDAYSFLAGHARPRPVPLKKRPSVKRFFKDDVYSDFMSIGGTVKDVTEMLGGSLPFWDEVVSHPDYDRYWKNRNLRKAVGDISSAVLVTGGSYDAEDLFGAMSLYRHIRDNSPETELYLAFGPWYHGGWHNAAYSSLGGMWAGEGISEEYMREVEYPFFRHYLEDGQSPAPAKVNIWYSGKPDGEPSIRETYSSWPPENVEEKVLYLNASGSLTDEAPGYSLSYSRYVSDPDDPVPFMDGPQKGKAKEYMASMQDYTAGRPDVLTFSSEPLEDTLVVAGPVGVDLHVSVSTADADFVVKLLDSGRLVRGDVMRGRYRDSFSDPEPFTPGETDNVKFVMQDVAHVFLPGDRIMVQVQSSWYPLVDMNPQVFTDIYECCRDDFASSRITVYHDRNNSSSISLLVLER